MHSNYLRPLASGLAVLVIGAASAFGGIGIKAEVAHAAPAKGTVTVKEGKRVVRAADHQKCLTLKEVRKIVHGQGTVVGKDSDSRYQTWDGRGKADYLDVIFWHGCADAVYLVKHSGAELIYLDYASPLFSDD